MSDTLMAARSFTDSAGVTWDVFEVRRASTKEGAVSAGLEHGWLAFVCGERKRRLAPFPPDWANVPDSELEVLCESARQAPAPRFPVKRTMRPRIKRTATPAPEDASPPSGAAPPPSEPPSEERSSAGSSSVGDTVRQFARDARARGLPAVAAMVELKTLLEERFPGADSEARDRKLVRRWFVETYYFDQRA